MTAEMRYWEHYNEINGAVFDHKIANVVVQQFPSVSSKNLKIGGQRSDILLVVFAVCAKC